MSLQVVIPELLSNTTSGTTGQMARETPQASLRDSNTSAHPLNSPAGHNATESGGQLSHL